MNSKDLNQTILIISQALNLLVIVFFAVFLAKTTWWVFSPSTVDVYVEKNSANQFDNSVKYVINRYPFGVIAELKQQAPSIIEKVKLSGIYLNTKKDSIAFLDVDNKHIIVKIGEEVAESVTLKSIKEDRVIVLYQGRELAILLSGGTAQPVVPDTNEKTPNSNNESLRTLYDGTNRFPEFDNRTNNKAAEEIRERRRQLLEEFEKQSAMERSSKDNANSMERNNRESTK